MVTNPQYLVVKHVPEIHRNEPRNIGVVVWTPRGVLSKFLGEQGGKLPAWIDSPQVFREWKGYWRELIEMGKIGNATIQSPEFLEALRATGKESYLFDQPGHVMDPVESKDYRALLEYLFSTLVDVPEKEATSGISTDIKKFCNDLIRKTRAPETGVFHKDKTILCPIGGQTFAEFECDYYVGNGEPWRIYQRVPIGGRGQSDLVHAVTFQFEHLTKGKSLKRSDCTALLMAPDGEESSPTIKKAADILSTQGRVLCFPQDAEQFVSELNQVPELEKEHEKTA
jgi:hypothetical protein